MWSTAGCRDRPEMTPMTSLAIAAANDNANHGAEALKGEYARLAVVAAGHWTGSKHVRGRDIAAVAKDIRADLKLALRGIKASVRCSKYSMGRSVTIEITEIPSDLVVLSVRRLREDLGLVKVAAGQSPTAWMSVEARKIADAIEQIVNAYNFDKSDLVTDYHSQEFHLDVRYSSEITYKQREEITAALSAVCKSS